MKERYNMKKKIIISLLLVIAIVLISVTCGLHVTAYNNTSKTNTVFVIDENRLPTLAALSTIEPGNSSRRTTKPHRAY